MDQSLSNQAPNSRERGKQTDLPSRSNRPEWTSLPAEVRLMIYRAIWKPRPVILQRKWTEQETISAWNLDPAGDSIKIHSAPPVTLRINSEAREETLRHYRPIFKSSTGEVAYINPEIDVLFVDYFPASPGPEPDRILGIIAVAKHITLPLDSPARAALVELLYDQPKRFHNVLIVDNWSRYMGTEENLVRTVWQRMCRVPGCTTHHFDGSPWLFGLQVEPREPGPWVRHLLMYVGSPQPWQVILKTCEEIAEGKNPCQVLNDARRARGWSACNGRGVCPYHNNDN